MAFSSQAPSPHEGQRVRYSRAASSETCDVTLRTARSKAATSTGVPWARLRKAAEGERSMRMARLPAARAPTPVIPEPENGSRTTSPGRLNVRTACSTTSGGTFVW